MKYTAIFIVANRHGLHIRTVAKIVKVVNIFKSNIVFTCNNISANSKSIVQILSMGVGMGEQLLVTIEGVDSAKAMSAIRKMDCLERRKR